MKPRVALHGTALGAGHEGSNQVLARRLAGDAKSCECQLLETRRGESGEDVIPFMEMGVISGSVLVIAEGMGKKYESVTDIVSQVCGSKSE